MFERSLGAHSAPTVRILKIEGTSQFIVSAGSDEYSFVQLEDAQRFANQLYPSQKHFEVREIAAGQQWPTWSTGSNLENTTGQRLIDRLSKIWTQI